MKSLLSKLPNIKKIPTIVLVLVATVATTILLSSGSTLAWGPERPTYTNAKPADYATFNSITDNASVGDERNFVRIREVGTQSWTDEIEVVPGKEYEVYIYYHNDAASDTNAEGYGMATNTHMSSAYPAVVNTSERGMVSGIIAWSYVTPSDPNNAKTGKVWDEAYVTTQTDGTILRYKTGTAIIHNDGQANGSVLPTGLFTEDGTPIGFNKLAGTIPGCAEYSGYVTYTLIAENTESTLDKQVSVDGQNWFDSVTVRPGDFVTYKVAFKNIGNTNFTNAIFTDTHDADLLLRAGSTKFYNVDHQDGLTIDDIIDISGYNAGDVRAGALVQFVYQMQVRNDNSLCGKTLNNTMLVKYNTTPDQKSDTTSVKVSCDETPTVEDCTVNPNLPGCDTPKEDCTTNPNLPGCNRIPDTGPAEIVLAIIIILGICGGGFYYWRTHRTLKTVEADVSGKTPNDSEKPSDQPKEQK